MVIEPETEQALAAALKHASDHQQTVFIRGAGTKRDWGRPASRADVVIDTRRLHRLVAHQHGDLTATVEAGAPLGEVNDALARRGQWLPLDPPFADRATIGGILATNDSGPLRHRYGTPRDLVIGVRVATADGMVAKAGGQVVKNVAGYDLSKLVTGSFGSLVAIVSATFKLAPLPRASKTIVISTPDLQTLGEIVSVVMSSQLEPIAFEIHVRSTQNSLNAQNDSGSPGSAHSAWQSSLLLRFASVPAAVDAQIGEARRIAALKGCATDMVESDAERTVWREHAERLWSAPGAIVRANWLPANAVKAFGTLEGYAADTREVEIVGRAAIGAGLIRIDGDVAHQAATIGRLRESADFSNVVIVRGCDALKAAIDVWGPQGDRERLFVALKRALDPNGVLNRGRGPL